MRVCYIIIRVIRRVIVPTVYYGDTLSHVLSYRTGDQGVLCYHTGDKGVLYNLNVLYAVLCCHPCGMSVLTYHTCYTVLSYHRC